VVAARGLRRPAVRRDRGLFLAEGPQAVEAGLAAAAVQEIFVGEGVVERHRPILAGAGVPVRVVTDDAVASLSETVTPQGIVGVAELPRHGLAELGRPRLVAVCVETRDPGNAGTIIRTADAAGADAVVFADDAVDPFGGKCVRSSAGSVFHLPVIRGVTAAAALAAARAAGCQCLATSGSAPVDLDELAAAGRLAAPTAWLFGNEARGLSVALMTAADTVVRVPVYGQAESLNLSVAAAICLYTSARVTRTGQSGAARAGGGGRL
jgi:RNA methyltransferase, TrmH family